MHGLLELQLLAIWAIFLVNEMETKFKQLEKFWDYLTCVELLFQVGVVDKSLKSNLLSFKRGRDNVAHYLTNQFKKNKTKLSIRTLNDQFKKGFYLIRN